MLFTQGKRDNYESQYGSIPNYLYWDQSARPLAELMRSYVENWAADFEMDAEFISKFCSKRNDHHEAALFELTAHAALRGAGLSVVKLPRAENKMPDFRVSAKEIDLEFFIECTLSADSFNTTVDDAKKNEVLEVIEGLDYFPYFVNVEFVEMSNQSISKTKLKAKIEELRLTCDKYSADDLRDLEFCFENNNWQIQLSLARKNGRVKRSLGYHTDQFKMIDPVTKLTNALSGKKASRYQLGSAPYVIMVNTYDGFAKELDFSTALFGIGTGSAQVLYPFNTHSFFMTKGLPVNTMVSAVAFCRNFHVFGLSACKIEVWHNPFAANPLLPGLLPFDEYVFSVVGNVLERKHHQKQNDAFELLGVSREHYISARASS